MNNQHSTTSNIKNVAKALLETKKSIQGKIRKDCENKHFGSRYSSLDEINRVIEPALQSQNLLLIRQVIDRQEESRVGISITIFHVESGEELHGSTVWRTYGKNSAHSQASAETYASRAAISHLLNLSAEMDDDANAAEPQKEEKQTVARKPATKKEVKLDAWDHLAVNQQPDVDNERRRFFAICHKLNVLDAEHQRAIIFKFSNGKKSSRGSLDAREYKLLCDLLQNCTESEVRRIIELTQTKKTG